MRIFRLIPSPNSLLLVDLLFIQFLVPKTRYPFPLSALLFSMGSTTVHQLYCAAACKSQLKDFFGCNLVETIL